MSSTVTEAVGKISAAIIVPIIEFIFALAVLYFIWGAAGFILYRDNPDKRTESQQHILYGVIGMFIMISAYGIIRFVASTILVNSPFG